MALKLETFESNAFENVSQAITTSSREIDKIRLKAYESGYRAGWDDATQAIQSEQDNISVELGNTLQRLSFTYYEAQSGILNAMRPVFDALVMRLLPSIAQKSLAPQIAEVAISMATDFADPPVHVFINPHVRLAVEQYLAGNADLPLILVDDPSLAPGQAYIRIDEEERRIDLDSAYNEIETVVENFFKHIEKGEVNG